MLECFVKFKHTCRLRISSVLPVSFISESPPTAPLKWLPLFNWSFWKGEMQLILLPEEVLNLTEKIFSPVLKLCALPVVQVQERLAAGLQTRMCILTSVIPDAFWIQVCLACPSSLKLQSNDPILISLTPIWYRKMTHVDQTLPITIASKVMISSSYGIQYHSKSLQWTPVFHT